SQTNGCGGVSGLCCALILLTQLCGFFKQLLCLGEDFIRRHTYFKKFWRGFQDFIYGLANKLIEQICDFCEEINGIFIAYLLDTKTFITFKHAIKYARKLRRITAKRVSCHHRAFTTL